MIKITEYAHSQFEGKDYSDKILVDMTAGRGQDTLFLASIAKEVYAFDIQKEAIETTRRVLENHHIDNVVLINDDHSRIDHYLKNAIDGGIYNLGYLPKGDQKLRTKAETTIASLEKLFGLLAVGGLIVIVCYEKDDLKESQTLQTYLSKLPSRKFDVMKHLVLNKNLSPYLITISKLS